MPSNTLALEATDISKTFGSVKANDQINLAIKKGKILGIFPEGGITSTTLTEAKPGAVYLASIANATVLPVSVRGASNAWDNIFRGVRSRIYVNIGKPLGPFDVKGSKEEKSKKLEMASRELMCRIAALLPDEKHGDFSGDPSIPVYQKENGLQSI